MTKKGPPSTIRSYMTVSPYSIRPQATLADAHALMRDNGIRHLPVVRGGRLVGCVSQRDLALLESLPDVEPSEVPVEDAMTTEVFTTSPDAPLRHVVGQMAERKIGSAVIMEGDEIVGVFTTTDALAALSQVLAFLPDEAPSRS